jgi:hypothetical protein
LLGRGGPRWKLLGYSLIPLAALAVSLTYRSRCDSLHKTSVVIFSLTLHHKTTHTLFTSAQTWQIEANTEAADAAVPEEIHVVEAEADEEVESEGDAVDLLPLENARRRRISWIWGSIWIKELLLNLLEGGKVRLASLLLAILLWLEARNLGLGAFEREEKRSEMDVWDVC